MPRYKEEYVGTTRLRQLPGSQWVAVKFRDGPYAGKEVKVPGMLAATAARDLEAQARAIVIEAARTLSERKD